MEIKRFEIYFVQLNPTIGKEINKLRPCLIISPDDVNEFLNTVIVAPLTSTIRNYPTRVNCLVDKRKGQIALDQMRAVDTQKLQSKLAVLDIKTQNQVLNKLKELFE